MIYNPWLSLALLTVLIAPTATIAGDTWASFQNGGRVSLQNTSTPGTSGANNEIVWTAELRGYGQSSPVVWDGQVYVTSVEGSNKETYHVTAYGLQSGKQLWQHDVQNASPKKNNNYVSRAAPTPAADQHGLVCYFEGGNLVALKHEGELRWERNLVEEYGDVGARHGLAASIEQDETSAYIWIERSKDPYVLSIDKQTGETNWKAEGLGVTSWSSPRMVPVDDTSHLVLSGTGILAGLEPQTGKRLWSLEGITGNSTPTPVPVGDGRFLIGATVARGGSSSGRAAASNGLVAINKADDGSWQADYLWRAKRATCSFGSPIAHAGVAYFVNATGVLYGLDLATGEERFAERLPGSTWATPVGIGERVLFFIKSGPLAIVAQGDSPEITTREPLPPDAEPAPQAAGPSSGSVVYGAAVCDELLLLRRGDRLYALGAVN